MDSMDNLISSFLSKDQSNETQIQIESLSELQNLDFLLSKVIYPPSEAHLIVYCNALIKLLEKFRFSLDFQISATIYSTLIGEIKRKGAFQFKIVETLVSASKILSGTENIVQLIFSDIPSEHVSSLLNYILSMNVFNFCLSDLSFYNQLLDFTYSYFSNSFSTHYNTAELQKTVDLLLEIKENLPCFHLLEADSAKLSMQMDSFARSLDSEDSAANKLISSLCNFLDIDLDQEWLKNKLKTREDCIFYFKLHKESVISLISGTNYLQTLPEFSNEEEIYIHFEILLCLQSLSPSQALSEISLISLQKWFDSGISIKTKPAALLFISLFLIQGLNLAESINFSSLNQQSKLNFLQLLLKILTSICKIIAKRLSLSLKSAKNMLLSSDSIKLENLFNCVYSFVYSQLGHFEDIKQKFIEKTFKHFVGEINFPFEELLSHAIQTEQLRILKVNKAFHSKVLAKMWFSKSSQTIQVGCSTFSSKVLLELINRTAECSTEAAEVAAIFKLAVRADRQVAEAMLSRAAERIDLVELVGKILKIFPENDDLFKEIVCSLHCKINGNSSVASVCRLMETYFEASSTGFQLDSVSFSKNLLGYFQLKQTVMTDKERLECSYLLCLLMSKNNFLKEKASFMRILLEIFKVSFIQREKEKGFYSLKFILKQIQTVDNDFPGQINVILSNFEEVFDRVLRLEDNYSMDQMVETVKVLASSKTVSKTSWDIALAILNICLKICFRAKFSLRYYELVSIIVKIFNRQAILSLLDSSTVAVLNQVLSITI